MIATASVALALFVVGGSLAGIALRGNSGTGGADYAGQTGAASGYGAFGAGDGDGFGWASDERGYGGRVC